MPPILHIICGDALSELRKLPTGCVHCSVTSPPYWGLRDYKTPGQLGLEPTPEAWCARLIKVFRELRRVLHPSGTLWLNIGDAYCADTKWGGSSSNKNEVEIGDAKRTRKWQSGCKPKDMIGLPWSLAFALRNDGWYLRSEITWCKKSPMPESVTDRPTCATEKIFLLSKRSTYFYDAEALKEESVCDHPSGNGYDRPERLTHGRGQAKGWTPEPGRDYENGQSRHGNALEAEAPRGRRNMRNFWLLGPEPYPEAHFAVFPTEIPKRAILAGTSACGVCPQCGEPWVRVLEQQFVSSYHSHSADGAEYGLRQKDGGPSHDYVPPKTIGWSVGCNCEAAPIPATVLDPFAGSGTTLAVALELGRSAIGIELNPSYWQLAQARCAKVTPGLALA